MTYLAPSICYCQCHSAQSKCCDTCKPKSVIPVLELAAINQRLERLEQTKDVQFDIVKERLEKLEKSDKNCISQHKVHWSREDTLFHEFDKLKAEFVQLKSKLPQNSEERPFKCPICMGTGKRTLEPFDDLMLAGLPANTRCHICDETGVLWG